MTDFLNIESGLIESNLVITDGLSVARLGVLPGAGSRSERALQGSFNLYARFRQRFRAWQR